MTLSQAFLVDNPSANASAKNGTDAHIRIRGKCFWIDGNLILFMVFVGLCRVFSGYGSENLDSWLFVSLTICSSSWFFAMFSL